MTHARTFSITLAVSIAVALAGCGGGSTARNDAGASAQDAANPGNDAASPGDDAASSDVDAAVADVDAASDVDAATVSGGACTNDADTAVLAAGGVDAIVDMCGRNHFGLEPGTRTCIENMSGLTMACADCFDGSVQCGSTMCRIDCAGSDMAACNACLESHGCNAAFQMCSGLAP